MPTHERTPVHLVTVTAAIGRVFLDAFSSKSLGCLANEYLLSKRSRNVVDRFEDGAKAYCCFADQSGTPFHIIAAHTL
jgi:hypothetical protein